MAELSEKKLTHARLTLMKHLDEAITELIENDNIEPGFWPDEVVAMMADCSLTVIKTVANVNTYMEREGHLKL